MSTATLGDAAGAGAAAGTKGWVSPGQALANEVSKFLGDDYVYGAAGPSTFDCSGLIYYAAKQIGWPNVPRTSEDQYASAASRTAYSPGTFTAANAQKLSVGDLIFSQWPGDNASPGHVSVYVGSGQVVEAPGTGQKVHKIPLDSDYYSHIVGTGKLAGTPTGGATLIGDPGQTGGFGGGTGDPLGISGLIGDFSDFAKLMGEFVNPGFWISTGALLFGIFLIGTGIRFLGKAATREVSA